MRLRDSEIFNMPCQAVRRTGNKKFADPERTLAHSLEDGGGGGDGDDVRQ